MPMEWEEACPEGQSILRFASKWLNALRTADTAKRCPQMGDSAEFASWGQCLPQTKPLRLNEAQP